VVSDNQAPAKLSSSVQPPSTVSKPDDPCVRKPTRPAKVFVPKAKTPTPSTAGVPSPKGKTLTPSAAEVLPPKPKPQPSKIQKLRTQLQPFMPLAPTVEQTQQALRRTKSVTTHKLVRQAVKLDQSAVQIADRFASEYSLKSEERHQVIRQVRTARMSQRSLAKKIRRMRWKFTEEGGKRRFIEWLDEYLSEIGGHTSESDEA